MSASPARPLDGQVALVTGGSRGIGRAVSRHLADLGARFFVNFVRDETAAAETVQQIESEGGRADAVRFDVAREDEVDEAVERIVTEAGRIDVLVNNAGIAVDGLVLRFRSEDWDRIMETNLKGTFHCTRSTARRMIRKRYGRIVNLSSVSGLMGNAGQGAYAAAKAGIIGFTKSMARELASRRITVNAVAPGLIETEMIEHLPEETRKGYLSVIPLGRLGAPEEIADAVAFLARPAAGYVTGQVIGVNGGLYM